MALGYLYYAKMCTGKSLLNLTGNENPTQSQIHLNVRYINGFLARGLYGEVYDLAT